MIAVLFDVHAWIGEHKRHLGGLSLGNYVQHICVFLRALMLQRDGVEVAVFLVGPSGATLLGSSSRLEERPHSDDQIVSEVVSAVQRCVAGDGDGDHDGHADATADADDNENATGDKSIAWASAFLQVLCHVKKYIARRQADEDFVKQRGEAVPTRILAIVSSSDPSTSKYLPFMNGFFAAQRDKIVVDCCDLDSHASTEALFRQGCMLTSGFYLKPTNPEALLEYLMTAFVADASSREYLRYPSTGSVDFRASCFCHQKLIDTGYVCSVCLSVFCAQTETCTTCDAKFGDV